MREKEVQAKRKRVSKNATKPFPLQEHDYFLRVGTRNGRAMEALGHEIFICSQKFFFFFSPRFHHTECIMLTNPGRPAGVEALHLNNTNIRTRQLIYRKSSPLYKPGYVTYLRYKWMQRIKYSLIWTSFAFFFMVVSSSQPRFTSPFIYVLLIKMFTFQVFQLQQSGTSLSFLSPSKRCSFLLYACWPLHFDFHHAV